MALLIEIEAGEMNKSDFLYRVKLTVRALDELYEDADDLKPSGFRVRVIGILDVMHGYMGEYIEGGGELPSDFKSACKSLFVVISEGAGYGYMWGAIAHCVNTERYLKRLLDKHGAGGDE